MARDCFPECANVDPDAMTDIDVVRQAYPSHQQTRSRRKTWGRLLQAVGGLGLGVLAVVYLLRGMAWNEVRDSLQQVSTTWVCLAVLLVGLTQVVKVYRWRQILGDATEGLSSWGVWRGLLVGQALNLLIPVRLGDVARSVMVGRRSVGSIFTFYTVVVEKAWESAMLLLCLGVLLAYGPWPAWLSQTGVIVAGLTVAAIVVGLGVAYGGRQHLLAAVHRISGRRGRWLQRLVDPGVTLAAGLVHAAGDGRLLGMALASLVVWGLGAVTIGMVFLALGLPAYWSAALLVLVTAYAGVVVPAPPARLGLFHFLVVLSLTAYGINHNQALACGIVLHLVVYVPLVLAGGVAAIVPDRHTAFPADTSESSQA
jgi:glycosyltransferase 2 family protein